MKEKKLGITHMFIFLSSYPYLHNFNFKYVFPFSLLFYFWFFTLSNKYSHSKLGIPLLPLFVFSSLFISSHFSSSPHLFPSLFTSHILFSSFSPHIFPLLSLHPYVVPRPRTGLRLRGQGRLDTRGGGMSERREGISGLTRTTKRTN